MLDYKKMNLKKILVIAALMLSCYVLFNVSYKLIEGSGRAEAQVEIPDEDKLTEEQKIALQLQIDALAKEGHDVNLIKVFIGANGHHHVEVMNKSGIAHAFVLGSDGKILPTNHNGVYERGYSVSITGGAGAPQIIQEAISEKPRYKDGITVVPTQLYTEEIKNQIASAYLNPSTDIYFVAKDPSGKEVLYSSTKNLKDLNDRLDKATNANEIGVARHLGELAGFSLDVSASVSKFETQVRANPNSTNAAALEALGTAGVSAMNNIYVEAANEVEEADNSKVADAAANKWKGLPKWDEEAAKAALNKRVNVKLLDVGNGSLAADIVKNWDGASYVDITDTLKKLGEKATLSVTYAQNRDQLELALNNWSALPLWNKEAAIAASGARFQSFFAEAVRSGADAKRMVQNWEGSALSKYVNDSLNNKRASVTNDVIYAQNTAKVEDLLSTWRELPGWNPDYAFKSINSRVNQNIANATSGDVVKSEISNWTGASYVDFTDTLNAIRTKATDAVTTATNGAEATDRFNNWSSLPGWDGIAVYNTFVDNKVAEVGSAKDVTTANALHTQWKDLPGVDKAYSDLLNDKVAALKGAQDITAANAIHAQWTGIAKIDAAYAEKDTLQTSLNNAGIDPNKLKQAMTEAKGKGFNLDTRATKNGIDIGVNNINASTSALDIRNLMESGEAINHPVDAVVQTKLQSQVTTGMTVDEAIALKNKATTLGLAVDLTPVSNGFDSTARSTRNLSQAVNNLDALEKLGVTAAPATIQAVKLLAATKAADAVSDSKLGDLQDVSRNIKIGKLKDVDIDTAVGILAKRVPAVLTSSDMTKNIVDLRGIASVLDNINPTAGALGKTNLAVQKLLQDTLNDPTAVGLAGPVFQVATNLGIPISTDVAYAQVLSQLKKAISDPFSTDATSLRDARSRAVAIRHIGKFNSDIDNEVESSKLYFKHLSGSKNTVSAADLATAEKKRNELVKVLKSVKRAASVRDLNAIDLTQTAPKHGAKAVVSKPNVQQSQSQAQQAQRQVQQTQRQALQSPKSLSFTERAKQFLSGAKKPAQPKPRAKVIQPAAPVEE